MRFLTQIPTKFEFMNNPGWFIKIKIIDTTSDDLLTNNLAFVFTVKSNDFVATIAREMPTIIAIVCFIKALLSVKIKL